MPIAALKLTHIEIINEVERLLAVNVSTQLNSTSFTRVLVRLLNEVIDEIADFGTWQELYEEILVTASATIDEYIIQASGMFIQHIEEISFSTARSPLNPRSGEEIRSLLRNPSYGAPRNYAIIGVDASSGNPKFRPYPVPGTSQNNQTFRVIFYRKPNLLDATVTADATARPVFPANLLIKGLYAKALLEENGNEPTPEWQRVSAEFDRMLREAHNRFNADTGTDIFIVPSNGRM